MKNYLKVLVALIFFLCLSCSKNNPIEPSEDISYSEMLDNVVFVPDSGPPGTVMEISNLMLPVGEDSVWSLDIGGQVVPLLRDSSAVMHTIIPLIFEDSNAVWVTTPSTPVNVTLFRLDKPVDSLIDMITIDSLAHASSAADTLIADLMSGADAIQSIALSMGITDTVMLATYDALDEILYTGENSLSNILNGNSTLVPGDSMHKEIFSALLVSSGYADFFSAWSDTLQTAAATIKAAKIKISLASSLTDEGLAARMQLQAFINDFGTMVVGNTAVDWQLASAVIGAAGIAVPAVSFFEFIVSYIVSELDFVINKVIVAAFPSKITNFNLDFMNHQINTGDTTEAVVYISAENNPPNITPMDIVMQVVGGMQLVDWIRNIGIPRNLIQRLRNFDQIIQDITVWWLGVINNILSTNYNFPTQLDVNFPHITWDSVRVENPQLIDLMIPDLSKMSYISGSFNGLAKDSIGKIGLQMRTQPPGPNTWIHPVIQSLGYAGGAFGNDLYISNVDTVTIVSELALQVDFANTITVGGANVLGLDAGYYDSQGNPHWEPNIDISLTVTDGAADVTNGVTDAQGHFSSIITIDSAADSVVVEVLAEGEFNSQADTIVVAISDVLGLDTLGSGWGISCLTPTGINYSSSHSSVDAKTGFRLTEGFGGSYYDAWCNDEDNIVLVFGPENLNHTISSGCSGSGSRGNGSGSSSAQYDITHVFDADSSYRGFSATASCQANFGWSVDSVGWAMSGSSSGTTQTFLKIKVDSGYFELIIEGTLRANNSDPTRNSETKLFTPGGRRYYVSDTTTSLTIADTTMLSPGGLYTLTLASMAVAGAYQLDISSGDESGSAGFSFTCEIRRAPMQ